ncbi:MAG: DUF1232 domain-containing protein [Bacteroides sp.]|nr:DUF1232 domain-containing protein [Bacteroides sp.]
MKIPFIESYQKYYSESNLWQKIASAGKKAGIKLVYEALQLYYAAVDPQTPFDKKLLIWGTLGYLILPTDLIWDFLPGGFVDDGAALAAAYKASSSCITPVVERNAKTRLSSWFSSSEISKL